MSETLAPASRPLVASQVWTAILSGSVAVLISGLAYAFSQGGVQSNVTELARRITNLEASSANQGSVTELSRRLSIIEQYGEPAVQTLKTQAELNGQRLSALEQAVGDRMVNLQTRDAQQQEQIHSMQTEITRFLQWRDAQSAVDLQTQEGVARLQGMVDSMRQQPTAIPSAPQQPSQQSQKPAP